MYDSRVLVKPLCVFYIKPRKMFETKVLGDCYVLGPYSWAVFMKAAYLFRPGLNRSAGSNLVFPGSSSFEPFEIEQVALQVF